MKTAVRWVCGNIFVGDQPPASTPASAGSSRAMLDERRRAAVGRTMDLAGSLRQRGIQPSRRFHETLIGICRETVMLIAFSVSWLVKGGTILRDRKDRLS